MPTHRPTSPGADQQRLLGQYITPRWAAQAILERHFGDLKPGSLLVEPSCGDGALLHATPQEVRAIGVEIDPHFAAMAVRNTGREVICGDFLQVTLPDQVDAVVGNPPFSSTTIKAFLDRTHTLLPEGGRAGFILPAYALQTSNTVLSMAE